jgi:hypothetical protein
MRQVAHVQRHLHPSIHLINQSINQSIR